MRALEIVWEKRAVVQFAKAIEFIYNDSPQNALRVKSSIEEMIDSLLDNPEKCSPDKYKVNNNKSEYRAFEKYHLRISYRFYKNRIRIMRVRHTKQNPQSY